VLVHVPDVVFPDVEDGCTDILEQMVAGWAEDNHYQVEVAEDIHKLEAVGQSTCIRVQSLNQSLSSYYYY